MALTLDLDERSRRQAQGLAAITVKLVLPSKARRAQRLEADLRNDRHDG
ncbi:hypothetical protein ACWF9G_07080 [Nocardia sp. NPDC055029]